MNFVKNPIVLNLVRLLGRASSAVKSELKDFGAALEKRILKLLRRTDHEFNIDPVSNFLLSNEEQKLEPKTITLRGKAKAQAIKAKT